MADCWSCGAERAAARLCPTCGKLQALPKQRDFYVALGLDRRMGLDLRLLEKAFRETSRDVHPDRFRQASPIERKLALEHTTLVNEAYLVLKDPQKRAEYLMTLEGIQIGGEAHRTDDPELLMEMMELGETVDAAKDEETLEDIQDSLDTRIKNERKQVTGYFDRGEGEQLSTVQTLNRLRYLHRILERVEFRLEEMN